MPVISRIGAAAARGFGLFGKIAAVVDAYFNYVTLLLPGNGTNGAQNNTFLDSSSNAFTITRNGNTTQGNFSPFSQTGWGAYYEGGASGGYITSSTSADYTFGTGDFTVEGWVYMTGTGTGIFQQGTSNFPASTTNTVALGTTGGTSTWQIYAKNVQSTSTATWVANTWYHYALVRSGTTTTLYINGTAVITVTADSTNYTGTYFGIGSIYGTGSTERFTGYMSNLRVVKGAAVYTANFTPPTSPLSSYSSGTTALLTLQSNRYIDTLASPKTLTVTSNTSIQAFSPFAPTAAWSASTNGGSGYFDGSGDYLVAGAASNWTFLSNGSDWTMQAWVYPTTTNTYQRIWCTTTASAQIGIDLLLDAMYPTIDFSNGTTGSQATFTATSKVIANEWSFISVTFTSSTKTCAFYINGAAAGSSSNTGYSYSASTPSNALYIGVNHLGGNPWTGYFGDMRISNSVRTGLTTVPTTPLTSDGNTSLLLNYTNGGIVDATAKNDLETVGNAQISTTQSKFGGSSMAFDGSGDYLSANSGPSASQRIGFGTGDFTVEAWVYCTSSAVVNNGIYEGRYSASATCFALYYIPNSALCMVYNGANQIVGTTFTINTWNHVALVRYSGVTKLYLNGTQTGGSYTDTNNYTSGANSCIVGALYDGSGSWNGYIDDLRVTRGIARYTSNFTPPTTAFPLQ